MIEDPVDVLLPLNAQLVEKKDPRWETTYEEEHHQSEDDFKHSHLTLTSLDSSCSDDFRRSLSPFS